MEDNFNKKPEQIVKKTSKQEPSTKMKKKKAKVAVITLSTIVVLFLGLQVYASTNGYGNVFFMIKNLITTGNPAGEQEIFSDKDITLSYKSIEVAEGLKIQANRLEIKDGKTKIYLSIKSESYNHLPLKYDISTTDNTGKLIKDKTRSMGIAPENDDDISYQEVITLDYEVGDNDIIIIKIIDVMDKELRTLEINLQTREITIKGEKDFEKISEIELKKYLSAFSLLNDKSNYTVSDNMIEIATKIQAIDNSKILLKRETINEIAKQIYGENVKFETKKDSQGKDVEVLKDMRVGTYETLDDTYDLMEHDREGKCLKIEDINYENEIYTVKYVYLIATGEEASEDKLEDLPQYETTIKLKRKEDNTYSKYEIVSLEKGTEIKNKVSTDVNDDLDNKQSSTGIWYTIDLYENNEIKIRFTSNDFDKMFGNIKGDRTKSYDIVGINGKVKKIYQSNNGTSVDPMTFFLLEDGTIQYILPFRQIMNSMPTSFKIDGKIDQVKDAVEIKTNNNDVVIAVLKNGQEVKIWNQFMENWGENETETINNTNTETSSNTTNNTSNSTTNIDYEDKLFNKSKSITNSVSQNIDNDNWKETYVGVISTNFKYPKNFDLYTYENSVHIGGGIENIENENIYVGVDIERLPVKDLEVREDLDRIVKSKDNNGWTDWKPVEKYGALNPLNGFLTGGGVRRTYARTKNGTAILVRFDFHTSKGIAAEHYTFIRNILENINSTGV